MAHRMSRHINRKGSVVKVGVGMANEQTNPMWSNASKTELVEDLLVANRYLGAMKGGIVLSSNGESCIPPSWQNSHISQDLDLWGTLFCLMSAKNSWELSEMWLTREPLPSIRFSFWTELRDFLLSLILARALFEGGGAVERSSVRAG